MKKNDDCSTIKAEDSCDSNSKCTWCVSAAVPSACYDKEDAAKLPGSIFSCDNTFFAPPAADKCESHSGESDCDGDSDCTWCVSAAVPSKCYNKQDAASLPSSIFSCDNTFWSRPSPPKEEISETKKMINTMIGVDNCESHSGESDCDGDSDCTWCVSAAVPSKCYNKKDAASLPSSIF